MRIKGFDKLTDMRSFSLVKREGAHTVCKFAYRTTADDALSLLAQEGNAITVQHDDGSTMFYGLLRMVSAEQSHHGAILSAEAMSYSVLSDEEKHTRIFQKPVQTLQDILPTLDWGKAKCELNLGEASAEKPAGLLLGEEKTNAVIQNDESDFSILRRLSAERGYRLWVVDTNSGRTELKLAKHLAQRELSTKDIISITRSRQKGKMMLNLRGTKKNELDTGEQIKIEGVPGNFIVVGKTIQKERETLIFDYEMVEENTPVDLSEAANKPRIFSVEIIDNNDLKHLGRVQVKFTDEGIEDKGTQPDIMWLPYRSPYGGKDGKGGIVFLPDKGDRAEALLVGRKLWVADSFRTDALLDECAKIEEKYIGNNTEQRVFWKEKSLELASFKNRITMNEDKIELTIGESKTMLSIHKDKIFLQTEKNAVELNQQGIFIKTENDVAFEATKNIQAKSTQNLRLESGKDCSIKAGGNAAVESASKTTIDSSADAVLKSDGKITIDGVAVNIC